LEGRLADGFSHSNGLPFKIETIFFETLDANGNTVRDQRAVDTKQLGEFLKLCPLEEAVEMPYSECCKKFGRPVAAKLEKFTAAPILFHSIRILSQALQFS
jgi:hypothetical protein